MSLKTWKKEFYPKKPSKRMSWIEAVKHSLKKWEGALKKNTKKHDVMYSDYAVDDIRASDDFNYDYFEFDYESCALCVKSKNTFDGDVNCNKCPLYKANKNVCCSGYGDKGYDKSGKDPRPMIKLLKTTLKKLQKEGA